MQAREIVSRSDLMKELHVHACSCIFAPKGLCCLHFVMQSTRANKYLIVLTRKSVFQFFSFKSCRCLWRYSADTTYMYNQGIMSRMTSPDKQGVPKHYVIHCTPGLYHL